MGENFDSGIQILVYFDKGPMDGSTWHKKNYSLAKMRFHIKEHMLIHCKFLDPKLSTEPGIGTFQ